MRGCSGELIFIASELFFGFALQSARIILNVDFGYELTMKYGNPTNMMVFGEDFYLWGAGLLALFFGWLADNIAGKWYVTAFGLIAAAASCTSPLLNKLNLSSPKTNLNIGVVLMLVYIATSGVRNAVILEQIEVGKKIKRVRTYIFALILVRIITYSLFPILDITQLRLSQFPEYFSIAATLISILYLILITGWVHKMYTESTYFLVWGKCAACVGLAVFHWIRMEKVPKEGRESKDTVRSILRTSHLDKPKMHVTFSTEVNVKSFPSDEPGEDQKIKVSFWGYRLVESPPRSPPSSPSHSPTPLFLESSPDIQSKSKNKKHSQNERKTWLDYAKPTSSNLAVAQTEKLLSSLILIFPPFFYSLFIFTILNITDFQVDFVIRPETEVSIITDYSFYLDVVLIPFLEYFFYPMLVNMNFKDWHFVFVGYLLLFMSALSALWIQAKLESSLQYIPIRGYAQVRLYNSLKIYCQVQTSWNNLSLHVPPYDFILIKNIPVLPGNHNLKIESGGEKAVHPISVVEKQTVSYIISQNLVRNSPMDPTLFSRIKDTESNSRVFLVTGISHLIEIKFESRKSFIMTPEKRDHSFILDSKVYKVYLRFVNSSVQLGIVDVEPSRLYSYFVALNGSQPLGRLQVVEGPLSVNYYAVSIQIIFTSLANIITSISFYTIVYKKSPEKLRATIFSLIVMMNLWATAAFNAYLHDPETFHITKVLIVEIILGAFLAIVQVFHSSKFET